MHVDILTATAPLGTILLGSTSVKVVYDQLYRFNHIHTSECRIYCRYRPIGMVNRVSLNSIFFIYTVLF